MTVTATPSAATRTELRSPQSLAPALDVVVPVYNEQGDVALSVRRLHAHLTERFPYPFRITVADNASTDETLRIAQELAEELPNVRVHHLDAKGRGRALNAVWSASDAAVLAYMDVDLSTDLNAVLPLVAPLLTGHSDLAIGTRLARSSRVVRGTKREVISRCYNFILRSTLKARFSIPPEPSKSACWWSPTSPPPCSVSCSSAPGSFDPRPPPPRPSERPRP